MRVTFRLPRGYDMTFGPQAATNYVGRMVRVTVAEEERRGEVIAAEVIDGAMVITVDVGGKEVPGLMPPAYSQSPHRKCGHIHPDDQPCPRRQPEHVARQGAAKARAALQQTDPKETP